jgi:hypothetical protein
MQTLLDRHLSREEIRDRNGPCPRTQRELARDPTARLKSIYLHRLIEITHEKFEFPWSFDWSVRLHNLHQLREEKRFTEIKNQFGTEVELCEEALEAWPECPRREAKLFLAANYYLAVALCGPSNERARGREKGIRYFSEFVESLGQCSTEPVARILRFKATHNIITLIWGGLPANKRNSIEISTTIKETGYFERAKEYMNIFPLVEEVPFSMLCHASVNRNRSQYHVLLVKLTIAAPKKWERPLQVTDVEFDSDFDDFRLWCKETMQCDGS